MTVVLTLTIFFYTNVTNEGAEIEKTLNILNFSEDGATIIGDRVMCEFSVTKMALATEELYFAYRRRIGKPCKPGLA